MPFVILSKSSLNYQSAFRDVHFFVLIWIGSSAKHSNFVTAFQSILALQLLIIKTTIKNIDLYMYISCLLIAFIIISQEFPEGNRS